MEHGGFGIDSKDLEYVEAACLLHNIGLINGRKGYHKHSYYMIMVLIFKTLISVTYSKP